MLEVTKKQTVKTRKKHECYGCLENIDKGTAAVHVRGKEDGRYVSFYLHVQCHITAMKRKLFVEGLTKGRLKTAESVIDKYDVDDTSCPF